MSKLIIVRGLPGSGKSTYAKSLGIFHIENDMLCIHNGVYKFDQELQVERSMLCFDIVSMLDCDVVVSNTFTTLREMNPYLALDRDITVVACKGEYESVHKVPVEVMNKFKARWEDYPGEVIV